MNPNRIAQFCRQFSAFILLMILGIATTVPLLAQQSQSPYKSTDFPYQAIVARSTAPVYSGPASVHYPTDELAQGDVVSVYRHDPNGWCAIMPPQGSFSLIPEAAIAMVADSIGVVGQDNVQAWVGTRLGSVDKPLWQVKLRKNEEVDILGQASWPSPDGHSTVWYQISPPAGEFRWVKLSDLQVPAALTQQMPSPNDKPNRPALARQQAPNQNQLAQSAFTETNPGEDRFVQTAASVPQFNVEGSPPKPTRGFVYRSDELPAVSVPKRSQPPASKTHVVAAKSYEPPAPPRPSNTIVSASTAPPKRDDAGVDFHFRPIGKTALTPALKQDNVPAETALSQDVRPPSTAKPATIAPVTFIEEAAPTHIAQIDAGWQPAGKRPQRFAHRSDRVGNISSRLEQMELASTSPFGEDTNANGFVSPDAPQWDDRNNAANARPFGNETADRNRGYDSDASSSRTTSPASFNRLSSRLSELEMQLTNEILKRPNEWQLSGLELSVEQVYAQTKDPVERLQAQRILDKLENCKKIRSGYAQSFQADGELFGTSLSANARNHRVGPSGRGGLAAARARLENSTAGLPQSDVTVGTGVNTDFEANALYDAHGWLTELVSSDRNNRPVYVLVSDAGKITHHIAAAPGVNLHRYLKSKVGVNGRQGFNQVLKLSHVTVDSVSELIHR